jgi:hypothetical protein
MGLSRELVRALLAWVDFLITVALQHLKELKVELEHHLEDIRLTIEAARRENVRDVWAQKSRYTRSTRASEYQISGSTMFLRAL